jgi:DNA-directed RNA polymerase subunit RPC12/RpoP
MNKFSCPNCGSKDFEITADTYDQVVFLTVVMEDGSIETQQTLKEYVGDTEYHDKVECFKCGKEYVLSEINDEYLTDDAISTNDNEYDGSECPFCSSRNILAIEQVQMDGREGSQEVECHDCGKLWRDIVKLTGWEKV